MMMTPRGAPLRLLHTPPQPPPPPPYSPPSPLLQMMNPLHLIHAAPAPVRLPSEEQGEE